MRLDGKSQYQIKKEKLQKIKTEIQAWRETWLKIKKGEIPDKTPKIAADEINTIWEIVKDE